MILQECGLSVDREQRELNPHGTASFPCAAYLETFEGGSADAVGWHWHEETEIIYIKSGCMKLRLPGKSFRGKTGELFFINSNILHAIDAETDLEIWSMVFHPSLVSGPEDSVYSRKYVKPLISCGELPGYFIRKEQDSAAGVIAGTAGNSNAGAAGASEAGAPGSEEWESQFADSFLEAFHAAESEQPGYEFVIRDRLSSCLFLLYRKNESRIRSGHMGLDQDGMRIRAMLELIQEHYPDDIGLSEIAGAAGIGERECLRCFKRVLQLSPVQYLIKFRIMKGAAMLVEKPGSSVAEISSMCGFDSPSNFTQTFRRFYRCTPREYRMQQTRTASGE